MSETTTDTKKSDWAGVWRTSFENAVFGSLLIPCPKEQAIRKMAQLVLEPYGYDNGVIETAITALIDREELRTCGIGRGNAIPYAKSPSVRQIHAGWFNFQEPLDWRAIDGRPCSLFYCQISPMDERWEGPRIRCLAYVERVLSKRTESWNGLKAASTTDFRQSILDLAKPRFTKTT